MDQCRTEEARVRAHATAEATRASLRYRVQRALRHSERRTSGTSWAAGTCTRCGEPFVSRVVNGVGRYCSDVCKKRDKASRRRARENHAEHDGYSRFAVFERDDWRCHLCGRTTERHEPVPHPRAPTIDHLVPLALGGDDTESNVATACFLCNSTKGHRIEDINILSAGHSV